MASCKISYLILTNRIHYQIQETYLAKNSLVFVTALYCTNGVLMLSATFQMLTSFTLLNLNETEFKIKSNCVEFSSMFCSVPRFVLGVFAIWASKIRQNRHHFGLISPIFRPFLPKISLIFDPLNLFYWFFIRQSLKNFEIHNFFEREEFTHEFGKTEM